MRKVSLKTIYLVVLSGVFAVAFFAFALFDLSSQRQQAQESLLEEARTFAREMDAVWQFMDNSQKVINTSKSGDYDFKGLHCSVVGKSVGAIFSAKNDYTIRYTNFNPRSVQDRPDDFEAAALDVFNADATVKEYSSFSEFEGEERFRYLQVLKVDMGCLECHGEPEGELDITGHKKEGWTLESVGGAISIVIPLDQQNQAMVDNVMRDVAFFLVLTILIGSVIYAVTTFFVFNPLNHMKVAFGEMSEGQLKVSIDDDHAAKEVASLIVCFNDMAEEISAMYTHLEEQVADRTLDLQKANASLERKRDDLTTLSKKLAKEAQFKSDLLSMVNHELRTPLTSIITFAQISKESCLLDRVSERHSWEEIEKNSQILLEMINNMLDIARSDAGSIRATCEPMDLGDIVIAVKSTMAPLAKKFMVSFDTRVAFDVPLVSGDFEKTQRILENLASNAVKFTPDGGSVQLIVEREAMTGDVLMRMIDNGIGVALDDQERIFDRFVQVDSTSTRKYNGSGLGLALVREYGVLQGFEVTVSSDLGCGSEFIVRIPVSLVLGDDCLCET